VPGLHRITISTGHGIGPVPERGHVHGVAITIRSTIETRRPQQLLSARSRAGAPCRDVIERPFYVVDP
jgi:hypothetical protein